MPTSSVTSWPPSDGWRVTALITAAILATILVVNPGTASANHTVTHTRCTALTNQIKQVSRDLRLSYLLCRVGREAGRLHPANG